MEASHYFLVCFYNVWVLGYSLNVCCGVAHCLMACLYVAWKYVSVSLLKLHCRKGTDPSRTNISLMADIVH